MVVVDIFSGLLAFVFGVAAVAKLVGQEMQVQTAERLGIPWHRYRLIAVPEAAASIGLLVGYASAPLAAAAAVGLTLLMATALALRLRIHDSARFVLGDAAIGGLAAATAVLLVL